MEKLGLNELRERFLTFFEGKGHMRLPSAPLVPQGDSSLLLINSGMAPLKPFFSGEAKPPSPRAATCQKCVRTPDIERVGKTSRHGTFFEMLGNFSFGDYFKREAIAWGWEFCTSVLKIPVEKLFVSVYLDDDEAFDIWTKEIGVEPSHMKRLGKADNFWEIGTGPCGPCSEIYYDRGEKYSCGAPDCAVGCDCDRYVEFWNLVFTQFSRDESGEYHTLERKNIDTGMGLERLACIMQGADNLFEVDTVRNILRHVSQETGAAYGKSEKTDVSIRVITDHIRSTVMMVCDGILPSNEGRGYILRRLLRRAARHGKLLGVSGTFLHKIAETVAKESGGAYPELINKLDYIQRVIKTEEDRFDRTIDAGLAILRNCIDGLRGEKIMPGKEAFKLYDTFGFPLDLTREILEEENIELELGSFEEMMEDQRRRARAARADGGDLGWANIEFGPEVPDVTEFTGYDELSCDAVVAAIVADGELQPQAGQNARVALLLDRTPFYPEGGGQVGDTGRISSRSAEVSVEDTKRLPGGRILHYSVVESGVISVGDTVRAVVDKSRRRAVMRAHSATHLLHKALRDVLGTHVEQAGSFVEPDRLRFDFSHLSAMSADEISQVARQVNEDILASHDVSVSEMPVDEARKLGAMALFGEKYGESVRVVQMGGLSTELCGGTHLDNTAGVGHFMIKSEASVASGVRRVEALVGMALHDELERQVDIFSKIAEVMHTTPQEMLRRAEQIMGEVRALKRDMDKMKAESLGGEAQALLFSAKEVQGLRVITLRRDGLDADTLRTFGDRIKDREASVVAVIATVLEDKLTFFAVCGKTAVERGISAGKLISRVCTVAGGKGGGRPDSAMGGGRDFIKIDDALAVVDDFVAENA